MASADQYEGTKNLETEMRGVERMLNDEQAREGKVKRQVGAVYERGR